MRNAMWREVSLRRGWGLTVLRVGIGGIFTAHGIQKAVVWGWSGGAAMFSEMGIPFPHASSQLVTVAESLGGVALVLGYRTSLFAALLGFIVLTALVLVHLPHGFFLPMGIEFVLLIGLGCVTLLLEGGGPAALDRKRGSRGPRAPDRAVPKSPGASR